MKYRKPAAVMCGLFALLPLAATGGAMDAYNVVWTAPSRDASESMPCGGGDIGLNVWVEDGDLLFYMQRSGSLGENNAYLKLGRIRLRIDPNPFSRPEARFRQELRLREGYVKIEGSYEDTHGKALDVAVRVWTEVHRPIVHAEVESSRPVHVNAAYENWRLKEDNSPGATCMTMSEYPGLSTKLGPDHVEHTAQGVLFCHRNPADTVVDILMEQQGIDPYEDRVCNDLRYRTFGGVLMGEGFKSAGTSKGRYQARDFTAWTLATKEPARRHHVKVVTHIDQAEELADWKQGLTATVLSSADDLEMARRDTINWWSEFWERSWIVVNPDKPDADDAAWRVGRNYNLFRYQLGCNALGEYPTKFNGGNFTFDGHLISNHGQDDLGFAWLAHVGKNSGADFRQWGGGIFTAQNQRLVYWPMLKSGDADGILPQFELYRRSLPGAKARVEEHFGHDGAVYSEYNSMPGVALGMGWGWESGKYTRGEEVHLGDPRADATRAYHSVVEKGVMANKYISYHWESQIEHAYMILEYHRFTGADIAQYMPFVENAVVFFGEHYRKRQEIRTGTELNEQGELVIFPSTGCESYRGATNPTDVVAGLQACLEGILELDESLLKLRDKAYYRAFLDAVPPYTYAQVEGDRVMQPAASWKRYQNEECPQFYPLFPFNRFNLLGEDQDHLRIFRDTWEHGAFPKNIVRSWHQDGIFFARMGMTEEARDYNTRKLDDSPRRYPTFWGPGNDWVPDHNWGGSGMIGLQEMLMQTLGDEIRLLPAWPKDWDVDFKLHAPHKTTVEGRVRDGEVIELKVTPESRKKDVSAM